MLAHVALRQVCSHDPYGFFELVPSDRLPAFLDRLWEAVRKDCDADGPPAFDVKQLGFQTFRLGAFPAVLVHLPPPSNPTEAWYVLIVLRVPLEALASRPPEPRLGYYTLERTDPLDETAPATILCAWDGDTHRNLGAGPPPQPDAFVAAVEAELARG